MRALRPGETFDPETLPSPAEALAAYAAALPLAATGTERVPLAEAVGRVLAADLTADAAYPADPRSTMDGFAVRAADGRAPRRLAGEVRMGRAPAALAPGTAQRIPTGGVLPAGADAVVPIEDAELAGDAMTPHEAPAAGDFFTPAGADMRPGDRVLGAGRRLGAAETGVLATLGCLEVEVFRRPRVAVISTGDELVALTARPGPGQVRDSNRWAIGAAFAAAGFAVTQAPVSPDDLDVLTATLSAALASADVAVLTGGSSVGARDLTPDAIARLDGRIAVHGIRVKPGKPTVLAAVGSRPVIGLPGNPSSALTIALTIAIPALRALTGETPVPPQPVIAARAATAFAGRVGWTWYVPVRLEPAGGSWLARPLELRSAHVSLLAAADGYVVVGPGAPPAAGAALEVVPLPRNAAPAMAVVAP